MKTTNPTDETLCQIYEKVWEKTCSPIAVIKALREAHRLTLGEAKDVFDRLHYTGGEYQKRQEQINAMWDEFVLLLDEDEKDAKTPTSPRT